MAHRRHEHTPRRAGETGQEGSRARGDTRAAAAGSDGQSGPRAQATRPGDQDRAPRPPAPPTDSPVGIREQLRRRPRRGPAHRAGASNVDAADNRGGRQRAALEEWRTSRQPSRCPDLSTRDAFTRAALQDRRATTRTERTGMFSTARTGSVECARCATAARSGRPRCSTAPSGLTRTTWPTAAAHRRRQGRVGQRSRCRSAPRRKSARAVMVLRCREAHAFRRRRGAADSQRSAPGRGRSPWVSGRSRCTRTAEDVVDRQVRSTCGRPGEAGHPNVSDGE
jgi:hypothetical protein